MKDSNQITENEVHTFTPPLTKVNSITILTVLFCQIVFTGLYFPYIPFYHLNPFVIPIVYISISISIYSALIFQWHELILRPFTKMKIDDTGIYIAWGFMKWEDLSQIKYGTWGFPNYPQITLKVNRNIKFWTFNPVSRTIRLMGSPQVYNEVIPLINRYRPDISIPESVSNYEVYQRKMIIFRKYVFGLCALIQFVLLFCIVETIEQGPFLNLLFITKFILYAPFPLIILHGFLGKFHTNKDEESFISTLLFAVGFICSTFTLSSLLLRPPLWLFQAFIFTCMALIILGLICLYFFKLSSVKRKIALFTCAGITAIVIFTKFNTPIPLSEDLSHFFQDDEWSFNIWDKSGRYLSTYSSRIRTKKRFVIDTKSLTRIHIPFHEKGDFIKYMDSEIVVRLINLESDRYGIGIYDFESEKEFIIDRAESLRLSSLKPISPDRKMIIWLTNDNEESNPEIRFHSLENLEKNGTEFKKIELPEKYKWEQVNWVNNNEIFAQGRLKKPGKRCCHNSKVVILRYDIQESSTRITVTDDEFYSFYPLSNFKFAFGKKAKPSYGTYLINLDSYKGVELSGSNFPSWIVDNKYGFRTNRRNGKKYFCKFDINKGKEEEICKISQKLELKGVSPNGAYAIFQNIDFLGFATIHILDINHIEWHKIDMKGVSLGNLSSPSLILLRPSFSMWAPNSELALLESSVLFPNEKTIRNVLLLNMKDFLDNKK